MPCILVPLRLEVGKLVFQCRDLCLAAENALHRRFVEADEANCHYTMDLHRHCSHAFTELTGAVSVDGIQWV